MVTVKLSTFAGFLPSTVFAPIPWDFCLHHEKRVDGFHHFGDVEISPILGI